MVAKVLRQSVRVVILAWELCRHQLLFFLSLTIIASLIPVSTAWVGKTIIDCTVHERTEDIISKKFFDPSSSAILWVLIEFILVLTSLACDKTTAILRQRIGWKLCINIQSQILTKSYLLPLRELENSKTANSLLLAKRDAAIRPIAFISDIASAARNLLTLVGYLYLLHSLNIWISVSIAITGASAFFAESRITNRLFESRNWLSEDSRRLSYYETLLTTEEAAKEVRLFALGPYFLEAFVKLASKINTEEEKHFHARTRWQVALGILNQGVQYSCYAYVIRQAISGQCTLGDMGMTVLIVKQGQSAFQLALNSITCLQEGHLYFNNLYAFLDYSIPGCSYARRPPKSELGLRFDNVSYKYPGSDYIALNNVSFFIPHDQSLAIVGKNGSGKSTIIKLAARLYQPTSGSVLLDGCDINTLPNVDSEGRISAIFQDYCRFRLTIRQIISLGDLRNTSEDCLLEAAQISLITEMMETSPLGLDSEMGLGFDGGRGISGGEWQRLALARAYFRKTASLLLFDEPTSAIDPLALRHFSSGISQWMKGRTSLLVTHSHRTAMLASSIAVMHEGCLVELGSHAHLRANSRHYNQLFLPTEN